MTTSRLVWYNYCIIHVKKNVKLNLTTLCVNRAPGSWPRCRPWRSSRTQVRTSSYRGWWSASAPVRCSALSVRSRSQPSLSADTRTHDAADICSERKKSTQQASTQQTQITQRPKPVASWSRGRAPGSCAPKFLTVGKYFSCWKIFVQKCKHWG